MKKNGALVVITIAAVFGIFLSPSCSSDGPTAVPVGGSDGTAQFTIGASTSYSVAPGAGIVVDTISGCTIISSPAGPESLDIAPVTSSPSLPFTARKFRISYTGADTLRLAIRRGVDEDAVLLMYTENENVAVNRKIQKQWWGVPENAAGGDSVIFVLPQLETNSRSFQKHSSARSTGYFAISNVPRSSSDGMMMDSIKTTIAQCIDRWLKDLPSSLRSAAEQKIGGDLKYKVCWSSDGPAYSHNNSRFRWNAIFYFSKPTDVENIAHEVGHYMTHVLTGYTRYNEIYNRFPTDFWGAGVEHGFGDYRTGRKDLLEDYAYYSVYQCTGTYRSNDLSRANVNALFAAKQPEDIDFPSQEGFGSILVASLLRSVPTTYDFTKALKQVPVIGMPKSAVLSMLAQGARDVNELRELILNYIQANGGHTPQRFAAMAEPLGWSYHGFGYIQSAEGTAVSGAEVQCIVRDGAAEYRTTRSTPSGADGKFFLPRIFPGSVTLRVYSNGGADSSDIPFTASWDTPTNIALDLGTMSLASEKIKITSVTPVSGKPGDLITIKGSGLNYMGNLPKVFFADSVQGKFVSLIDSTLTVRVPIVKNSSSVQTTLVVSAGTGKSRPVNFTVQPLDASCFTSFQVHGSFKFIRNADDSTGMDLRDTIVSNTYYAIESSKLSVTATSLTLPSPVANTTRSATLKSCSVSYLLSNFESGSMSVSWWDNTAYATITATQTKAQPMLVTANSIRFGLYSLQEGSYTIVRGESFVYENTALTAGTFYVIGYIW
jgi:hypothetical protein